jgi:flagellar hook-associated protein 3 FlgL
MRVSTNTVYQLGINKIGSLTADQSKLNIQISSGKRILSPADDPVAATRALELSNAKSINKDYTSARDTAQLKLDNLDSNLSSVTDLLVSAKASLVAAGNGAYSDQERASIATELSSNLQNLLGLANTQDESGNYLYSGFKSSTQPFTGSNPVTYAGDSNEIKVQVESGRTMAINLTGDSVFQANGTDVFQTFNDIIGLLNTPITSNADRTAFNTGLATAIGNIQKSTDTVINARADVGSKLKEIDTLNTTGTDKDLQYDKAISNLQDLDYATAISDLSKNQTILQAAQQSFVKTTSLSLFNYVS